MPSGVEVARRARLATRRLADKAAQGLQMGVVVVHIFRLQNYTFFFNRTISVLVRIVFFPCSCFFFVSLHHSISDLTMPFFDV